MEAYMCYDIYSIIDRGSRVLNQLRNIGCRSSLGGHTAKVQDIFWPTRSEVQWIYHLVWVLGQHAAKAQDISQPTHSEGYWIYHLGWVLSQHTAKAQDIYRPTRSEGYWIYHLGRVLG